MDKLWGDWGRGSVFERYGRKFGVVELIEGWGIWSLNDRVGE